MLRKIGNSRGIIIPAALLAACKIDKEVDLRLEGKSLIIESPSIPRKGWFENYSAAEDPAEEDLKDWNDLYAAEDSGGWEW